MQPFRILSAAIVLGSASLIASAGPASDAGKGRLPFIENDYARAVREAKAKGVPIFVEAWAPW